jgi:3-oxoacyl-[acyl-carrier-protein] synthase II
MNRDQLAVRTAERDHPDEPARVASVVVTGIGVSCPIGQSADEVLANVVRGRGGIGRIHSFDTTHLKIHHAAEIADRELTAHFSESEQRQIDRTAQLAIIAARSALADSGLRLNVLAPHRIGLVVGICAGGQGGSAGSPFARDDGADAQTILDGVHYAQTDAVGHTLDLHGPRATVSTACASSATALAYAYELLQSGKVDVVLAGGADAFSFPTYAGFYALGAMAARPSSPFSAGVGVTFGEGAGFVVLETSESATRRGADLYGELIGYGSTGDAYHITAPHPSGEGLFRAMRAALDHSGLTAADIDYVNAHGTGTRDNDTAETLAVKHLYRDLPRTPPMSSTKSFIGHTLGAAGILEFIVSMLCQRAGILPPTINFAAPRPGCDLDYVPNQARPAEMHYFLSNSAAFGGVNTVLVGGTAAPRRPRFATRRRIVIAGMGAVSPIGCGTQAVINALRHGVCGIKPIHEFDVTGCRCRHAAVIRDFNPKHIVPMIDVRRMDRLNQFAIVAAALAFRDAGLDEHRLPSERIGVVAGLTRGPVATQQRFLQSLHEDGLERLSAKHFPAMVLSTLAGEVSRSLQLRALNSTIVDGTAAGLHALVHAFEMLRNNDSQDALVVVAADEIGAMTYGLQDRAGLLADDGEPRIRLYESNARGMVLGEGATAMVIETLDSARARGARGYVEIAGCGLSSDSSGYRGTDPDGLWLTRAMELALDQAGAAETDVDVVYGHGRGVPAYDRREATAMARLLRNSRPWVTCVNGHAGIAEANSGALSVLAAAFGLRSGEVHPLVPGSSPQPDLKFVVDAPATGSYRHALIAGSTANGNNAALVLRSV